MIKTDELTALFLDTRQHTESICKPLKLEDYVVQPTAHVSPPKWHLGHTSWFFEAFLLQAYMPGYKVFDPDFTYLFNSYYEAAGERLLRTERGNMTRPSLQRVYDYRHHVTNKLQQLLSIGNLSAEGRQILEIGIHHEKQHQELLLSDIKYILGHNPLFPVYRPDFAEGSQESGDPEWLEVSEGVYQIGHTNEGFCYDNELDRHRVFLEPFEIRSKLVTNGEFMAFMEDGAYNDHRFWHSEGIDWVRSNGIQAPLYWHNRDDKWFRYSLGGLQQVDPDAPLTHISYYEAYAFANWNDLRLPTEFEWEAAQAMFHWGQRWEWTESAYLPYPGFKAPSGALGEYNGKFMVNQKVLRGGSVATPPNHTRPTYRNFFHPHLRWQFTGIRLAR